MSSELTKAQWFAPTLRGYQRRWLRADVVAGLSAGAVVIPQAMAYATIADLPVQIGLYTCMVPMVVYAFLGGSRANSVSTTSTIATLTASTLVGAGIAAGSEDAQTSLMTLTLMVGVILLIARLLRLGSVVENISEATLSGIKAGVGLTVAVAQLPKLLGVPSDPDATGFFRVAWSALREIGDANTMTIFLAAGSIGALYLIKAVAPQVPGPLVVVAAGIALAAFAGLPEHGVELIAPVPTGIPMPGIPSLDDMGALLPGALAIAVMAFLETVSVARGVRARGDRQIDSDQELLANGAASVAGAFFHTLAPAGGFSQTAIALRAGARSQVAGLVTALLAVLVAYFLAPVLSDLPQATLGALVVFATLGLVDLGSFGRYWRINRTEFWVAVVVAVIGLFAGLLAAVLVGVLFTLYLVLRELDRAHVVQLRMDEDGRWVAGAEGEAVVPENPLVLRFNTAFYAANVRSNAAGVLAIVAGASATSVVLDCSRARMITTTVMHGVRDLMEELGDKGVAVYFAAIPPDDLERVLRTDLGRELSATGRFFPSVDAAVAAL